MDVLSKSTERIVRNWGQYFSSAVSSMSPVFVPHSGMAVWPRIIGANSTRDLLFKFAGVEGISSSTLKGW